MAMALTGNNARLSPQTTVVIDHGLIVDVGDDLSLHLRSLGSSTWHEISAVWVPMTPSERQALLAFLDLYRLEEIELSIEGETYVGRITATPQFRWLDAEYGQVMATIRARKTVSA